MSTLDPKRTLTELSEKIGQLVPQILSNLDNTRLGINMLADSVSDRSVFSPVISIISDTADCTGRLGSENERLCPVFTAAEHDVLEGQNLIAVFTALTQDTAAYAQQLVSALLGILAALPDTLADSFANTAHQLDDMFDRLGELCTQAAALCREIYELNLDANISFSSDDAYVSPEPNGFGFADYSSEPSEAPMAGGYSPSFGGGSKPPANSTLSPAQPIPMPAPPMPAPPAHQKQELAGTGKKVKPTRVDSVAFSVLSPDRVAKGEYGSVNVYMYTKSQRRIIEKAIKQAKQQLNETEKAGFRISRGSEVTVIICSEDVEITDNVDTRTWDGDCINFDFQFFVPANYTRKQAAFTCFVLFNGIQITRLHFSVRMSAAAKAVPVKVKRKDCRKAFVSYCRQDEKRVLANLLAIAEVAPRMVFWMDTQSLESGDMWSKEIERAIRNADVLLLFWSVFAMKSDAVRKEWTYALKKKGLRFISPVPLDPPQLCPPPEQLSKLHFDHRAFYQSEEADSLNFVSSRQFRKIR